MHATSAYRRLAVSTTVPALFLAVVVHSGCSSSTPKAKPEATGEEWSGETRDTTITHEDCNPAGHEARTFKGDSPIASGKTFVTRVYDGGHEICAFADLNGDGNVDVYTFTGADGRIRRREAAYTVSKNIDEIALYEGGELKMVMRETNFDGKLDTWDYYEGGKLARRERDKNGDGRIDEWWTFQPGTDNATVVQADSKTGKPDPTQTVTMGVGASVPGLPSAPAAPPPKPTASAKPSASATTAQTTAPLLPAEAPLDAGAPAADAGKPKKGK